MIRERLIFAFQNYLLSAEPTAPTLTPSSEATRFEAENIRPTGKPWWPWKTTGTGEQYLEISFDEPQSPQIFALPRVNFTTARLQAHDSPTWDDPDFDQEITIKQNGYNWRYQYGAILPSGLSYTDWRLLIPSQDTTDGLAAYLVGGLWLAPMVVAPTHFSYDIGRETLRPGIVADLASGGTRVTTTGNPCLKLTAKKIPSTSRMTPGLDDALAAWNIIDGRIFAAGRRFLIMLSQTDTTETYVVDDVGSLETSRTSLMRAASTLTMAEAVGP